MRVAPYARVSTDQRRPRPTGERSEPAGWEREAAYGGEAAAYNGILPCFFGGFLSRFVSSAANA